MKTELIEKMNTEKQMYEAVKSLIIQCMNEELADLKTNEIMRITGHSFTNMSSDDKCPYCNALSDGSGHCLC